MLTRILAVFVLAFTPAAHAATVSIVALGASNTAGYGVSRNQSYPAQLQAMLRTQGYDVRIANAGISGDTAAGMLRRLSAAVPKDTRIVILDPGNNDIKACTEPWRPQKCATRAEHDAQVATIVSRLRARGIKIFMANIEFNLIPLSDWQADRRHMTPNGHRVIAERLAAPIANAISRH